MEHLEQTKTSGKIVRATNAIYSTFEPNDLPLPIAYDEELIKALSSALLSLGNLSNAGERLPNPHLLIAPYLNKEAVFSSKIEGTRTSLSEVFLHEKEETKDLRKDSDLQEVLNYIKAMKLGLKEIEKKELSEALIKKMHAILMNDTRGAQKDPGEYKLHQNWIGMSDEILEARFVPASPKTTPKLMQSLIDYTNNSAINTELIKAAMIHYQFETIHPFRDGNGRLGRLLIILYLCKTRILSQPLLYLSAYFEKNRELYNERLLKVSLNGEVEPWLKFFLKGIKIQADQALETVKRLEEYHLECREKLQEESSSNNALRLLDCLFANPYITVPDVQKILKTYYPTAKNNVNILIKNGILKEYTTTKLRTKGKIFYAPRIIEILS